MFVDQKVIQTTLPRNPTRTIGCAVVASSNRSGGTVVPTVGGSTAVSLPNRSQTVQASAKLVTSAMTALGQSNPFPSRSLVTRPCPSSRLKSIADLVRVAE
ncbi:hypothetical protein V5E97_11500 [Singulisphaera sp. Ch08]|uniref:Uncharacterized protein n=1 Tax=Singulisphaera sp. Ch08 TaxID=3120278 RepID=A0AAU7CPU7_9BACT